MIPSFGRIYGPLASMVALLLWAVASSFGLLYGVALTAELEAVRDTASDAMRHPGRDDDRAGGTEGALERP